MELKTIQEVLETLGITRLKRLTKSSIARILLYLEKNKFATAQELATIANIDYKSIYIYVKELISIKLINVRDAIYRGRKRKLYSLNFRTINQAMKFLINEKINELKSLLEKID